MLNTLPDGFHRIRYYGNPRPFDRCFIHTGAICNEVK
jgi:hypothetical protein